MNLREKLEISLEEDFQKWKMVQKGPRGYDWVEYCSPQYESYHFVVDHQAHVFKNGEMVESYTIWPFTQLSKLITNMQKYTLEKTECFHIRPA